MPFKRKNSEERARTILLGFKRKTQGDQMVKLNGSPEERDGEEEGREDRVICGRPHVREGWRECKGPKQPRRHRRWLAAKTKRQKRRKRKPTVRKVVEVKPQGSSVALYGVGLLRRTPYYLPLSRVCLPEGWSLSPQPGD